MFDVLLIINGLLLSLSLYEVLKVHVTRVSAMTIHKTVAYLYALRLMIGIIRDEVVMK